MMVKLVSPVVIAKTFGVLPSVFGGEPQVAQPPPGTVRTSTVLENVRVSMPSVRLEVVEKFAPGIVIKVVPLVYAAVGWEMTVNWAKAGIPARKRALRTTGLNLIRPF